MGKTDKNFHMDSNSSINQLAGRFIHAHASEYFITRYINVYIYVEREGDSGYNILHNNNRSPMLVIGVIQFV